MSGAALLAAARTSSAQTEGVTASEILIGSCAALEGPANALGTQTVLGAKAYLNHINEGGG
ncbi:MAG TPA: ABC transporter permease, partial [Vicinamibacteria bacterium]|nr:ABC transporter permease [Vicinamibacteria bacterium]